MTPVSQKERREHARRLAAFKRKFPLAMQDLGSIPATIIGVGDKEICLLDATYADFKHYQAFIERRITHRRRIHGGRQGDGEELK